MKYTLLVTQRCNLECDYCYIGKGPSRMSVDVATRVVDFAFRRTPQSEKIEIGFFGGEPLLELPLIEEIACLVRSQPGYTPERVGLTVVTNGTPVTVRALDLLCRHDIALGISCDGPPDLQDRHRRFRDGRGTGARVEAAIRQALERFPAVMVNAVYGPDTVRELPRSVEYFARLGVRQIYLSPDFSANWSRHDLDALDAVYAAVGERYAAYYQEGVPRFVSLIDSKIAVLLRQGYHPLERCRMGRGEYAFTPAGDIYPCERLVGSGGEEHRIGNVFEGFQVERMLCHVAPDGPVNRECLTCGLRKYCMNSCGCSNYFGSGYYNRVSPFGCASEKASIRAALEVFKTLESSGVAFYDHMGGAPAANSLNWARADRRTHPDN